LIRDGEWGLASIPVVELRGVAIDLRMLNYAFVILEESGAACEFGLDDIYYDGGGVANPPIAHAGPDQIIEDIDGDGVETVILDGSASTDRFGSIQSFTWSAADTLLATGETSEVILPLGEHAISLMVTDSDNLTSTDQVLITVLNNYLPVANAGTDQTVVDMNGDGFETIVLNGSNSSDSDGTILSYSWSEAGNVIATGVEATVDLAIGAHLITLTVTDNDGGTASDALAIRVNTNLPVQAPAIYFTHANISIDESIEPAWFDTPEMGINNVTVGSRTADFSAQWKGLFDTDNLYILVEVNDGVLINDSGAGWYMDDCVEIFIDGDNSSGTSYDGVNDLQFGFRWNDPIIRIGNNSVNNIAGINFALYATAVGYNLEVSIPWSTIGVSAGSRSNIGFDVAVDDDDNGGDRECAIASMFTEDNAWHNPSVFGNVPLFTPTGIDDDIITSVPGQFSLQQNYPNPFNPTTIIQYGLAKSSNVRILVYNTLGQEIAVLMDAYQGEGFHKILFNGNNLSSGVYFVVMEAGSEQFKRKIVLLK